MSTLTVSTAGKSPDPVLVLQVLMKSMDLGVKGPRALRGATSLLLSVSEFFPV